MRWIEKLKRYYVTYCPVCIEIWCWTKEKTVAGVKWFFWPLKKIAEFVSSSVRLFFVLVDKFLAGAEKFEPERYKKEAVIILVACIAISVPLHKKFKEQCRINNEKMTQGYRQELSDNVVSRGDLELFSNVKLENFKTEREEEAVRQELISELKKYQKFYGVLALVCLFLFFRGLKIKPPDKK